MVWLAMKPLTTSLKQDSHANMHICGIHVCIEFLQVKAGKHVCVKILLLVLALHVKLMRCIL